MQCPVCESFSAKARVISFKDFTSLNALKAGIYERSMQHSLRKLKKHFNRCTECGRWVCDDCFICSDKSDSVSLCADCAKKKSVSGVSTGETKIIERGGKKDEM